MPGASRSLQNPGTTDRRARERGRRACTWPSGEAPGRPRLCRLPAAHRPRNAGPLAMTFYPLRHQRQNNFALFRDCLTRALSGVARVCILWFRPRTSALVTPRQPGAFFGTLKPPELFNCQLLAWVAADFSMLPMYLASGVGFHSWWGARAFTGVVLEHGSSSCMSNRHLHS